MTDLLTVADVDELMRYDYLADNETVHTQCETFRRLCATARVGARAVEVVKEVRAFGTYDKQGCCDEILRRLTAPTETRGKP